MATTSAREKGAAQLSTGLLAALAVAVSISACGGTDRAATGAAGDRPFPADWLLLEATESVVAEGGMVATGHPLASRVGAEVLERGGNAIDAAVAVGFALAVVLPEAGNLGGGGFLVYRDELGGVFALDYRETAPAAAHHDMYLDAEGAPTEDSRIGHLAAGVPGSVAGMAAMHERFGSLPWDSLVEPAVELALGHEIDAVRAANLAGGRDRLVRFEASASQFLVAGEAPPAGHWWVQPELADTLGRIASEGADDFYRGETAALIAAEMERGGGIIDLDDLATYRAVWRDPVRIEYRDRVIWSMPPPSSGGVTMAMIF
ncbi:MAG: gamma-glutamyltransferase, partial [Thermoanaerobaculia bacterium]|nr:gamma-glutamyltransferase [Thermoanaerobaculia bacterium]